MKRNDMLTVIGLVLGIGMMIFGMLADGADKLKLFWSASSVAITVGGSLAAVMIVVPMADFKKFGVLIGQAFKEPSISSSEIVATFGELSRKARKEGLLSLEDAINNLEDAFLKKGLQMVVDGIEPESIKDILELEIAGMETRHKNGADIFKTWGAFAPGFGMLGTLIGLIQMLGNLSDASTIATGMGQALITTYYGSLVANLFASPVAQNLMGKNAVEVNAREMMIEGILAIQSGVNPRIVEDKLLSYLSPQEREEYARVHGDGSSQASEGVA